MSSTSHNAPHNPYEDVIQTDEKILRDLQAHRITGAPLNHEVKAMARRMGLQQPVEVYISRSKAINARMMQNVDQELRVIITEPLLDALRSSAHGNVSQELKFVLGHELGHIAEGGMKPYLYGGFLPILALPFVAIWARHYLEGAHQEQLIRERAQHYIHNDADKDYDLLAQYQMSLLPTKKENLALAAAKDLAVGALGFGAGSFVAKVNSDKLELRCDKWGAKMTSPQAGINSFTMMENAFAARSSRGFTVPDSDPFRYGDAKNAVQKTIKRFLKKTITSHPDDAVRIGKFEKMIQEAAATAAHAI